MALIMEREHDQHQRADEHFDAPVSTKRPEPGRRPGGARTAPGRLFIRWFGLLCAPAVLAAGCSYLNAMNAAGNLSTVERSVEWLRGHHYGDTVSWIEYNYYSRNQPRTGGTLAGGLPRAASTATTTAVAVAVAVAGAGAATGAGAAPGAGAGTGTALTPDSIAPLAQQPVAGEGVWQPYGDASNGTTAMQVAYLRPDDVHGTVLAGVVRIDQSRAMFRLIPGSQEPGHGPWPGGNHVAAADTANLLAGFNSGFRVDDSRGGFAEGGKFVGALRSGAASLVISTDGSLNVVNWGRDLSASDNPVAVRQNLDLIVDGGQLVGGLDDNLANRWGKTVGNKLFVWRSGIGIDASGRIIYVASEGLSVNSLAALLQRAGAVRAMELDINHAWVSFNAFHHDPGGTIQGTKLLDGMSKSENRYLGPDSRDFFAVVARQPLSAS